MDRQTAQCNNTSTSGLPEPALKRALALYQKCLSEIDRGILPCYVPTTESSRINNGVVSKLIIEGYNVQLWKRKDTRLDEFHNHTYEVEIFCIAILPRCYAKARL